MPVLDSIKTYLTLTDTLKYHDHSLGKCLELPHWGGRTNCKRGWPQVPNKDTVPEAISEDPTISEESPLCQRSVKSPKDVPPHPIPRPLRSSLTDHHSRQYTTWELEEREGRLRDCPFKNQNFLRKEWRLDGELSQGSSVDFQSLLKQLVPMELS